MDIKLNRLYEQFKGEVITREQAVDSIHEIWKEHTLSKGGEQNSLFEREWRTVTTPENETITSEDSDCEEVILLVEPIKIDIKLLEEYCDAIKQVKTRFIKLQSEEVQLDKRYQFYAQELLEIVKSLLKELPRKKIRIRLLIFSQCQNMVPQENSVMSGLFGILTSSAHENPLLEPQVIELDVDETTSGTIENLEKLRKSSISRNRFVRVSARALEYSNWKKINNTTLLPSAAFSWRDNGVYLVTGGLGGLGLIFSREIALKAKDVTLILTGRRSLQSISESDSDSSNVMSDLKALGANCVYYSVDVTNANSVSTLLTTVENEHGQLNGIIHSAGVVKDNFLANKSIDELREVLDPKVAGLTNLVNARKGIKLDLFVAFSSISGQFGNVGQADYAAANGFMDAYVKYQNDLMGHSVDQGSMLSINWPLWEGGGMQLDSTTCEAIKNTTGITPMQTEAGLQAFYQAINSGLSQVLVVEGDIKKIERTIFANSDRSVQGPSLSADSKIESGNTEIDLSLQSNLAKSISKILNVSVDDIDLDIELSDFGFDQMALVELATSLQQEYRVDTDNLTFSSSSSVRQVAEELVEHFGYSPFSKNDKNRTKKITPKVKAVLSSKPQEKIIVDANVLVDNSIRYFRKLLSSTLKLPIDRIEPDAPLERYGLDSIMILEMTNQLEEVFGSLPKTLFFEYQDLNELSGYFVDNYSDKLYSLLADELGTTKTTDIDLVPEISVREPREETSRYRRNTRPKTDNVEQQKDTEKKNKDVQDIAIIGLSGRYPQATTVNEFWDNLRDGKDCITEIPQDRWDHDRYFDTDKNSSGKSYSKWGGFIDGVDQFDPLFFNISPNDAKLMDPQERLFLQCVYETIEDAGYTRQTLAANQGVGIGGNVGVFVGVMYDEYQLYGSLKGEEGFTPAVTCNTANIANRVSYFCNFHGPSMALDTMCSSSLTTLHLACQSLQQDETELAIAGGVNVSVHPNKYLMLSQGRFVSSKGRCESFGEGGEGYVPGEGVGAVLLKPLQKAIDDGDHIYGVIKGSAVNHGGRANGYTVPNPNAQARVINSAFKRAGMDPRTVSYMEAHGTGTSLGDPIELAGLNKVFREHTKNNHFCAIGSAKSNIGHCESAAGIAGLTKVLMQLKHKKIAPSLHSQTLNPNIDFENNAFVVQQELSDWKRPVVNIDGASKEYPRRAGISAFGAGGSNAHVIIEEYIADDLVGEIQNHEQQLILLSAKTEESLEHRARALLKALTKNTATESLRDIAYTLQVGREEMERRLAVIVSSVSELKEKLQAYISGNRGVDELYLGQTNAYKDTFSVLKDEDMSLTIEAWISKKKYHKLTKLWVNGLQVDWQLLYKSGLPKKLSLPTYPFSQDRYWVDVPAAVKSLEVQNRPIVVEEKSEDFFYRPEWRIMPQSIKPSGRSVVKDERHILFVYPSSAQTLTSALMEHHQHDRLSFIEISELSMSLTNNHWYVPSEKLQQHLLRTQSLADIDAIYFICSSDNDPNQTDAEKLHCNYEHGPLALFRLIKGVNDLGLSKKPLDLKVITQQVHHLPGDTAAFPAYGGGVLGLTKTLCNEYAKVAAVCLDVENGVGSESDELSVQGLSTLATLLVNEPASLQGEVVAFRENKRYVRHFEPTNLAPIALDTSPDQIYRKNGVYMILGGASGIGLELAKYLAKHFQARLAIVGRSPTDSTKQKILSELSNLGGKAIYLSADIVDLQSMQAAVSSTKAELGGLHGVVHSAVVLKDMMLDKMDESAFNLVTSPKIQGCWNVAHATAEINLDFMVFFSSVAGFAGIPGQGNYAAAATFEDSFASHLSQQRSYPVKVINWGPWGSVGVAANEHHKESFNAQGIYPIDTEEGINAIAQILTQKDSQIIAFKAKDNVLQRFGISSPKLEQSKQPDLLDVEEEELSNSLASIQPKENIDSILRREFSELSGIDTGDIDEHAEWIDMGIDSIKMMKMLETVETHWGLRIYPNELQEYSTLNKFVEYLREQLNQENVNFGNIETDALIPLESENTGANSLSKEAKDVQIDSTANNIDLGPNYDLATAGKTQKPLIYILSTPRAGSTLLRVMLMGNSALFSPPELHLLPFESSKQRAQYLEENNQQFLGEGFVETLAELEGFSADDAVMRMHELEQQDLSIKELYGMLQDLAGDRFVIDKSPSYADDIATLAKAEHTSDDPLYIFLIRHPLSVIESFVRNRFDKLLGLDEDPWQYAENLWLRYNSNLRNFLATIPLERQCIIRYEDLVVQPEHVIKQLCSKWGIAFDEKMLTPYEGKRMTSGLREHSMTIGDPNFARHNSIDASLANSWQGEKDKLASLKPETLMLAEQLGYAMEDQFDYPLLPSQRSFLNLFNDDPTWHIVQKFEQSKDFDFTRYKRSLQLLVDRNAALRVSFVKRNDEWVQRINEKSDVCIDFYDLSELDEENSKLRLVEMENSLHQRLTIECAPLLTSAVAQMRDGSYHVILVVHHLVSDGITLHLINNEWMTYYDAHEQDETVDSVQVKIEQQYLACIEDSLQLQMLPKNEEYLEYWQQQINSDHKKPEEYPRDYVIEQDNIASECSLNSSYSLSELGINNYKTKAQLFDYLSVALYDCVSEWAGDEKPVIAHRLHRRNLEFNERHFSTMGWLAGDVVVDLDVDQRADEKLKDFQNKFSNIPMGGISYEILHNQGLLDAANDVAAVRLNYQPDMPALKDIDPDIYLYESAEHKRLYLLDIIVRIKHKEVKVIIRYSKNRHKLETIKVLMSQWIKLTKNLIVDTDQSLKNNIVTADKTKKIIDVTMNISKTVNVDDRRVMPV